MTRTHAVTKVHPITFRTDDTVVGWIFTLTLTQDGVEAMDTISIPIDPDQRKLLMEWTRAEVAALIQATLVGPPIHPKVISLHRLLDTRAMVIERTEFTLADLPA